MKKLLLAASVGLGLAVPASSVTANPASTGLGLAGPQAIGLQGAIPDFAKIDVESPHVYDYTFASAPTDWRVQSGIWEMTNRWACSPGWSWFGGRSDEVASIWSKRKFTGDVSVQMYFAFKMGLAGTPAWKYHPSDAALTIGGDGQNLSSGYSLIIGADDNSRSVLRRGAQVVAENKNQEALLPTYTDGEPDAGHKEYEVLHRRWWYVRVDKIGNKVSCYLDNKLLFSYEDPKPLDAGQIAIWTYNNGIMLSRVQVYYDKEMKPVYARNPVRKAAKSGAAKNGSVKTAVNKPIAAKVVATKTSVPEKFASRTTR